MLKKWFEIITDHRISLRERMFRIVTGVCMIAIAFTLPMGRSVWNILMLVVSLAAMGVIVRISIRKQQIHTGATVIAVLLLTLFPVTFFSAGGFYSGVPEWFVLCFIYVCITLQGKRMAVFFMLCTAETLLCYGIAFYFPDFVVRNPHTNFIFDSAFSMIVVGLLTSVLLMFLTRMYEEENAISQQQKKEIEELNRAENHFFSSMSHEIRTPINTIIGLNEIILRGDIPEEVAENARNIQGASKLLLTLINDILDLSKIKSGKMEIVNVSYETAEPDFDNFMFWVNFQPMLRRIYGCSFLPHHDYGKGGRGWRDLWQDCLALLIMQPDDVRQMLIDNYGGVRIDGSNATIIGSRQGEFIADRNNITRVWMDHGLWPLMTTKLYIDQTGDLDVLLKENTYFKDKQEARGTGIDESWEASHTPVLKDEAGKDYCGTLLEHILVQNLTVFYEVGEHNHMRLRGADWNDALDMAADRGESVAFTAAYADNLEVLADLIGLLRERRQMEQVEILAEMEPLLSTGTDLYEDAEQKRELLAAYCRSCFHSVSGRKVSLSSQTVQESLREKAQWIKEHIRRTEWIEGEDCGWFNSYYDNHGRQCEGMLPEGTRMMLTGQVFTVMSGTATHGQTAQIVKAADRYLYKKEAGGYRLNTDFAELKTDLGRMFGFAYGHKENGAVFSHMTTMYANALYRRGFNKEGYRALHTLYEQVADFETSRIYPGIPEYFNDRGRGMYHYLTGAASWMMLTVITEMFGVKGSCGDLVLEPHLLKEQFKDGRAGLKLNFGGRKWHIVYVNGQDSESGDYRITGASLDGKALEITEKNVQIPLQEITQLDEAAVHEIVVELG